MCPDRLQFASLNEADEVLQSLVLLSRFFEFCDRPSKLSVLRAQGFKLLASHTESREPVDRRSKWTCDNLAALSHWSSNSFHSLAKRMNWTRIGLAIVDSRDYEGHDDQGGE
jgi:hypothetical protein